MRCPVCHTATVWDGNRWRPFCSERCQLIDLGIWAAEEYRLAGRQLGIDTDDDPEHIKPGDTSLQ
ncbi:MAG: DNA gyrase inhibitor YacG [Nitrospira sp.]